MIRANCHQAALLSTQCCSRTFVHEAGDLGAPRCENMQECPTEKSVELLCNCLSWLFHFEVMPRFETGRKTVQSIMEGLVSERYSRYPAIFKIQ